MEQTGNKLVLFVAAKKRESVGVVNTSHSIVPILLEGLVLSVRHIQTGEPHVPEG